MCIDTFDKLLCWFFPQQLAALTIILTIHGFCETKLPVMTTTGHFSCGPYCLIQLSVCERDVSDVDRYLYYL